MPYKGAAGAVADLAAGHLPAISSTLTTAGAQIRANKVRALAISSNARLSDYPDVPTFKEQGFPDLVATLWYGIFAPAATPAPTLERINLAINRGLKQPRQAERVNALGMEVMLSTPAALAKSMRAEYDAFGILIRDFGIKPSPN